MTGKTGVVFIAAFKFNSDYIQGRMPMHTASLIVYRLAINSRPFNLKNIRIFWHLFLRVSIVEIKQ
jgi:hypothetical protein